MQRRCRPFGRHLRDLNKRQLSSRREDLPLSNTADRSYHLHPQHQRVHGLQSRVSHRLSHKQFAVHGLRRYHGWSSHQVIRQLQSTTLQSAFPKKTAIFGVLVAGLLYYFVDIQEREYWVERMDAMRDGGVNLHFYKTKEDVEHYLREHIPDPLNQAEYGEALDAWHEMFEHVANAFVISEEDAIKTGSSVTHGAQVPANAPCEDHLALGVAPGPGGESWNYWGVYDGHAGRWTSLYLQTELIPAVSHALAFLQPTSSSVAISKSIMSSFTNLDNHWMQTAKRGASWYPAANSAALCALMPVYSGSCALLACFDPTSSKLRIANTGDSRAVLGRWDPLEGKYIAHPLSFDQTGFNKDEVERITAEHPDEPDIIDPESGRLLGIAVTRGFGDHRWKWDNDFVRMLQTKFWGPAPRPGNKTPPYMTAEPVVTETQVLRGDEPDAEGKADFMIMASDGLWDNISSEHAVELVNRWLEAKERGNGKVSNDPRLERTPIGQERYQLDPGVEYDEESGQPVSWRASPEYFAVEDDNAAVCLIRNAFGGTRRQLFAGIFALGPPLARNVMDDTTVLVVFFDRLGKKKTEEPVKAKGRWWPW